MTELECCQALALVAYCGAATIVALIVGGLTAWATCPPHSTAAGIVLCSVTVVVAALSVMPAVWLVEQIERDWAALEAADREAQR